MASKSAPSYGIEVNRQVRGEYGNKNRRIELEGSNQRSLKQLVRYWSERLQPKPTLLLNLAHLVKTASFTSVALLFLWHLIWYTPFWSIGVMITAFLFIGGIFFSMLAYMDLPYSKLWSLLRLVFLVCALCALSL